MLRSAPKLTALLLCAPLIAGCASTHTITAATGGETAAGYTKKENDAALASKSTIPSDLESGVRQAQLLRQAGQYDNSIRVLSQLMLVASDDPRVVGEYGKALAQKGRAQDSVDFLKRAIELQGNDWTLYSAIGVAYDQLGNQTSAKLAYEHALMLHPNEPSVLNNYALSRMLANDPATARLLIDKAGANGGASNSKIAANIAMLDKLAPAQSVALAAQSPVVERTEPVTTAVLPAPAPTAPAAQSAPHPVAPNPSPTAQQAQPQKVATTPASNVVMQKVPADPLAGPVKVKAADAAATKASVPSTKAVDINATKSDSKSAASAAKPQASVAPSSALVPPRIVIADTPAKPAAKTADSSPAKAATPKAQASATPSPASSSGLVPPRIVIAEAPAKPAAPAKTADAKPLVKTASKDDVPALRLAADARTP